MGTKERRTDEILRYEARTNFKGIEGVDAGLKYFRKNPEELFDRVNEFDQVCIKLNNLMGKSTFDPDVYQNVATLKDLLEGRRLPTLTGIVALIGNDVLNKDKKANLQGAVETTLKEVKQKSISRRWEFPTTPPYDPGKIAAGMLIEGYGLFAEKYYGKEGLARTFVLAFEEVLVTSYRMYKEGARRPNEQSKLLADVIDWMVEDKDNFSPFIRHRLVGEKLGRKVSDLEGKLEGAYREISEG